MEIIENIGAWKSDFDSGWLAEFQSSGRANWDLYSYGKNSEAPSSKGVKLRDAKLLLITSSGSFLKDKQSPFDAANQLGDYSIRTFPTSTSLNQLDFAHDHYKQESVRSDVQVLIPIRHLEQYVSQRIVGELFDTVISFMGYQPDISRVISETIPAIQSVIDNQEIDAALLVPS